MGRPPAENENPVHGLIKKRWSGRSFSDQPVEDDVLFSLFEAVRWAASSYNEQPWNLIVARRGESSFDQMLECLDEYNKSWAFKAPILLLTVAKMTFDFENQFNRHAMHDLGLAMGNFSLQATEFDLNLCQMAGFDQDKAKKLFGLPEDHEAATVIAIGYRGSPDELPDQFKKKELSDQQRKEVKSFVFKNKWGIPID